MPNAMHATPAATAMKRDRIGTCPPSAASGTSTEDRPICRLITAPAIVAALNRTRTSSPIASPTTTCVTTAAIRAPPPSGGTVTRWWRRP